ncbi:MAG: hypothetical protein ACTSSP_07680, partial [Candidatus Asgardarchaeia archaeon]
MLFKIVKYKFLSVIRSKEFYIYIIGIPLVFMIIYGAMSSYAYSSVEPMKIGFINNDTPLSYSIGNSTYNAYLITGEEPILIDTVKAPYYSEMLARIKSV